MSEQTMSFAVELLRSQSRALVLAGIAVGVAGCSADSTRFFDNFTSRSASGEVTGSVASAQPAPIGRVETAKLAPPATGQPATQSDETGIAGGSRGMASFRPGATASPDVTGTVPARKPPAPQWTWDGGTAIIVAQGETIDAIARRHGVPAGAIMQANSLTAPAILYPGQRLVIPRVQHALAPPSAAPRPMSVAAAKTAPATVAASPAQPNVHVIAAGETLSKLSRLYHKSVGEIAKANSIEPQAKLNIGDRIVIPNVRVSSTPGSKASDAPKETIQATPAAQQAAPAKTPSAPKGAAAPKQAPNPQPAAETAAMVTPAADTSAANSVKGAAQAAAPTFRWPVHGKVIAGFGPRPNGQQNDGINVAVPENTPVKAAEDGVVAYAGNELKGYGNLVLVRHSNGYVTAYAHAKELLVKRGDPIKRGQVIAKSGQTGNVDAPQLHFEVRKGPTPQDPMPMLNGG
jgi:murein DD-endopeptidase MepM/ murein hydrolase activator NlpD